MNTVPQKQNKTSTKSCLEIENFNFLQEALKFDPQNNEIATASTDWLLVRGSMFRDIIDGIKERSGNAVVEEIGRKVGQNFASHLIERKMQPPEIPTIIDLLCNQGGWGKAKQTINNKTKSGSITIENCITARQTHSKTSNCYFLRLLWGII